jgi:hypothetical protein
MAIAGRSSGGGEELHVDVRQVLANSWETALVAILDGDIDGDNWCQFFFWRKNDLTPILLRPRN